MPRRHTLALASFLLAFGCAPPLADDGGPPPAGDDGGVASDAGDGDGGSASGEEEEPNDGDTDENVNALVVGQAIAGAIAASDDVDAFHVETTAGMFYRVHLSLPQGSLLEGHLTVLDDGRGDDMAGGDYTQLSTSGAASDVNLDFLAMGEGGHYVIVRDARNVGGAGSGSAQHRYEVSVEEQPAASVAGALSFGASTTGTLAHAGALDVYRFEAAAWDEIVVDVVASGDMDGRLWIVATATGDWIVRNDDRSGTELNPRIDAPLSEGGELFLVVDNVAPAAVDLAYSLTATLGAQ